MIGGGIETPCKYLIYADKKLKSKIRTMLRKASMKLKKCEYITHLCLLNFPLFLSELEKSRHVMKRMKKNNNKNIWSYIRGAYNRDEKSVSDLMGL